MEELILEDSASERVELTPSPRVSAPSSQQSGARTAPGTPFEQQRRASRECSQQPMDPVNAKPLSAPGTSAASAKRLLSSSSRMEELTQKRQKPESHLDAKTEITTAEKTKPTTTIRLPESNLAPINRGSNDVDDEEIPPPPANILSPKTLAAIDRHLNEQMARSTRNKMQMEQQQQHSFTPTTNTSVPRKQSAQTEKSMLSSRNVSPPKCAPHKAESIDGDDEVLVDVVTFRSKSFSASGSGAEKFASAMAKRMATTPEAVVEKQQQQKKNSITFAAGEQNRKRKIGCIEDPAINANSTTFHHHIPAPPKVVIHSAASNSDAVPTPPAYHQTSTALLHQANVSSSSSPLSFSADHQRMMLNEGHLSTLSVPQHPSQWTGNKPAATVAALNAGGNMHLQNNDIKQPFPLALFVDADSSAVSFYLFY